VLAGKVLAGKVLAWKVLAGKGAGKFRGLGHCDQDYLGRFAHRKR